MPYTPSGTKRTDNEKHMKSVAHWTCIVRSGHLSNEFSFSLLGFYKTLTFKYTSLCKKYFECIIHLPLWGQFIKKILLGHNKLNPAGASHHSLKGGHPTGICNKHPLWCSFHHSCLTLGFTLKWLWSSSKTHKWKTISWDSRFLVHVSGQTGPSRCMLFKTDKTPFALVIMTA